jgi:hypothetical protein
VQYSVEHAEGFMVTGVTVPDTQAWPPSTTAHPRDVARLVITRLREDFQIESVRQTGAALVEGHWLAQVGIWPHAHAVVRSVEQALEPMEVTTYPHPGIARRC